MFSLEKVCEKDLALNASNSLLELSGNLITYEPCYGPFTVEECREIRDKIWNEIRFNSVPSKLGDEFIYRVDIASIGVVRLSLERRDDISKGGKEYFGDSFDRVLSEDCENGLLYDRAYIDMYDWVNCENGV